MIGPRKATDPAREAPPPLPPPRYLESQSPLARLGRWLFDRLTRR